MNSSDARLDIRWYGISIQRLIYDLDGTLKVFDASDEIRMHVGYGHSQKIDNLCWAMGLWDKQLR